MQASTAGDRWSRILAHPSSLAVFLTTFIVFALLFLMAPLSGSVQAHAYSSPHGGYSGITSFCEVCHATHEAGGGKLLKNPSESALCFTCHNGTGSIYNTQAQMDLNPQVNAMHPILVNLPNNNGSYTYTPNTTAGLAPPGPYTCSQCHNPHGDVANPRLLRARYDTSEYVPYPQTPDPYASCWTCHVTGSIVNDMTYFPKHSVHINQRQSPCTACHFSPHGVNNTELVKFNPAMVTASPSAGLGPSFVDRGANHGSCTLSCHGWDHNDFSY